MAIKSKRNDLPYARNMKKHRRAQVFGIHKLAEGFGSKINFTYACTNTYILHLTSFYNEKKFQPQQKGHLDDQDT